MLFLQIHLLTLLSFIMLDTLWLGWIAKNFYQENLSFLMTEQFVWPAIIAFYLIYSLGVTYFVIDPSIKISLSENSKHHRKKERDGKKMVALFFKGALFGLVCYSTYDLTNFATIKSWPIEIVWVDLAWGSFMTGFVSVFSYRLFL